MHELSLCRSVIRIIDEEARRQRFERVRRVHLTVGAFSHAEGEAIRFAFPAAAAGSIAEGAALEIERGPGRVRCLSCGAVWERMERVAPCGDCGDYAHEVLGGDELKVTSLEVI